MNSVLLPTATTVWLGATALWDLRKRMVPNWLTLPVLVASILWGIFRGDWPIAAFVLLLILLSDLPIVWGVLGAASLIALYQLLPGVPFNPGMGIETLALFGIWCVWKLGKMGGADLKVLLAITLVHGPWILLAALLAGGVFALLALLRHQRTLPFLVPVFYGSSFYFLANLVNFR